MNLDESFRIPESVCPNCNKNQDSAKPGPDNTNEAPVPGDYAICINCQTINVYGDNLELREPTIEELLHAPTLEISQIQRVISEAFEKMKKELDLPPSSE